MRPTFLVFLLSVPLLAGCIGDADDVPEPEPFRLQVYHYQYEGSDTFVEGVDHGWLLRVSNPGNTTIKFSMIPIGVADGLIGPIASTGGAAPQTTWLPARIAPGTATASPVEKLEPGASGLVMVRVEAYEPNASKAGVRVVAADPVLVDAPASSIDLTWNITRVGPSMLAAPGDHVQTVTVGVWLNGTAFYSNAAGALQDPDFPHAPAWTSPSDDTTPLAVYVYDQDRDEQPAASADRCHFTTISGYNTLLKSQAVGSTNVAFLRPESAYTMPGYEEHPLYGAALVFLNTVVAHDGATTDQDQVPDPTGDCFQDRVDDATATVEDLLPPVRKQ